MSPRTSTRKYQPAVEFVEQRLALSAPPIPNPLAVVPGTVPTPNATAEVSYPVSQRNIGQRHSIIIGTTVAATPGSSLIPVIGRTHDASGRRALVHPGGGYNVHKHPWAQAYVRTATPGPLTTGVTGRQATTGNFQLTATLPGDVNGDGQVNLADETAFADAFLSTPGDAKYNPAADFDHNGFVGIGDAKFLLRNITPLTPKQPLIVDLSLTRKEFRRGPNPKDSGGVTNLQNITIVGHTTPGSFVFTDRGIGDYTFSGGCFVADAHGNFSFPAKNKEGLNNYEVLVIDPYGQQTIRDYPVFWAPFAAPGSKLK